MKGEEKANFSMNFISHVSPEDNIAAAANKPQVL